MPTQPETLRLADRLECSTSWDRAGELAAATELRRLHAENASLAAALASSCDEQRHELWESGGIAGCERARVAERQRDALLEALKEITPSICHVSIVPEEKCAQCGRIARARAAIKAAEENT